MTAALDFRLPPALEASAPPEERGLPRDAVRLMVARGGAPLPTVVADILRDLAEGRDPSHPALAEPGWWRREERLLYPPVGRGAEAP